MAFNSQEEIQEALTILSNGLKHYKFCISNAKDPWISYTPELKEDFCETLWVLKKYGVITGTIQNNGNGNDDLRITACDIKRLREVTPYLKRSHYGIEVFLSQSNSDNPYHHLTQNKETPSPRFNPNSNSKTAQHSDVGINWNAFYLDM